MNPPIVILDQWHAWATGVAPAERLVRVRVGPSGRASVLLGDATVRADLPDQPAAEWYADGLAAGLRASGHAVRVVID